MAQQEKDDASGQQTGRSLTMSRAMVEAIAHEMRANDEVFYMGEDVADYGGIFDSTEGLLDEFGRDRIMDVPISETAYLGAAVGAAQEGMRPIAELMFVDFFGVAMDQIYNQMAKKYLHERRVGDCSDGAYRCRRWNVQRRRPALPDALRDVRTPPGDEGGRALDRLRREGADAQRHPRR